MCKKVDLYMENAGKAPKEREAWYGYVLTYQGKQLYTTTGFASCRANRHRRDLVMFLEALMRCKECFLTVHTDSTYLKGGYGRIPQYIENGWITSGGAPVKNRDLWQKIHTESQGKEIHFVFGRHEFTEWLKAEIRRRRDAERSKGKPCETGTDHKTEKGREEIPGDC